MSEKKKNRASPTYRKHGRRIGAIAAAAVLLAGTGGGLASGQTDDFIAGSGISQAQVIRVGPSAARLSLAPTLGLSLSDYLGTLGRGEARAADWAAIGVAEPALDENTPQVRVESTDENSEEGVHEIVAGGFSGGGGGGLIDLFARATDDPFGESHARLDSFIVPGVVELHGGEARTSSGIVAEGVRQSISEVTIGRVDLGGGSAVLEGLRWEAIQRTGEHGQTVTGSFTIQAATVGGEALPIPVGGSDIESVLGPLNEGLEETGFAIVPPTVSTSGDVARVSPLSIQIVDSPLGRQVIGPIFEGIHPVREPLFDVLIGIARQIYEESDEQAPNLVVAVLAADLTLGILSGASRLHIELGGANAFTEGQRFEDLFAGAAQLPPFEPAGVEQIFEPGTPAVAGAPGTPGLTREVAELAVAPPVPGTRTVPGDRGGIAVMVGLIGLAVAGALAAADWYRMRRNAAQA